MIPQAITEYQEILKRFPNHTESLINLATIYEQQSEFSLAQEYLERAIRSAPHQAYPYTRLGLFYEKRKQEELAMAAYQLALSRNPAHADTHYFLGRLLAKHQQIEEAIHHYKLAIGGGRPDNQDSPREEDRILATLGFLVRALHYEIAPSLESIRSNTELLKGEESRVCVHTRLCHIAQEVVRIGRVLQKAQHLSALRVKTAHGITMLDLEETVERRSLVEWEQEAEDSERMILKVRDVMRHHVQSCGPDTNLAAVAKIM